MADRREYFKQYRERNKERIKQVSSEYYNLNREDILAKQASSEKRKEWRQEKVTCNVCGAMVCNSSLSRHKKTNKCMNYDNKKC